MNPNMDKWQRDLYKHFPADSPLSQPDIVEHLLEWFTFFRRNITVFIEMWLMVPLHMYQVLVLNAMSQAKLAFIVAGRGTAKSWMVAIYAVAMCILYPGSEIVIASATLKQASLIVNAKIKMELMGASPRIREEIEKIATNQRDTCVTFRNGSTITVVVGSENARGYRSCINIYEECRMIKKEAIDSTMSHFLRIRPAPFMALEQYKHYTESNISIYITSSWYADHWMWADFDKALGEFLNGGSSFAIGFDYALTLRHKIKSKEVMASLKKHTAQETWDLECLNLRLSENAESFFKLSAFTGAQKIRKAFYPQTPQGIASGKKNPYLPERLPDEIRLVSVDLAFMSGAANDNSIYECMRLLPYYKAGGRKQAALSQAENPLRYKRQIPYLESVNGGDTLAQAIRIKQLFYDFDADYLVLDFRFAGVSVFDLLTKPLYDEERDVEYEAWTCINNEDASARVLAKNAKPCIYCVTATAKSNSDMALELGRALADGDVELLLPYEQAREEVLSKNKEYMMDTGDRQFFLEAPYVQTQALIKECVDLRYERMESTGIVRVFEHGRGRKDRYTATSYANWFASELERDMRKADDSYGFLTLFN